MIQTNQFRKGDKALIGELDSVEQLALLIKGRGQKTEDEMVSALGITRGKIRHALVRAKRKLNARLIIKKLLHEKRRIEAAKVELEYHFPTLQFEIRRWCGLKDRSHRNHGELECFIGFLRIGERWVSRHIRSVGPEKTKQISGILREYGLRLGMTNFEIARLSSHRG